MSLDDTPTMIPVWVDGALTEMEKLEVHRLGLRHPAISVFVMDGDRVLLQRRALSKYHTPGLWANTCCTHPHWGETTLDCAVRRLEEELGIAGLALDFKDQLEYRADVGGGLTEHEVVDIFVADAGADLQMRLNPSEVAETDWIDLATLRADTEARPERYTPWLRIYMSQFAERIFPALVA